MINLLVFRSILENGPKLLARSDGLLREWWRLKKAIRSKCKVQLLDKGVTGFGSGDRTIPKWLKIKMMITNRTGKDLPRM